MRIQVRSQNAISFELRSSIERRLQFVLGRFSGRVSRVTVLLTELNGVRGKPAKRCKVIVQLFRRGQVRVEDSDADIQSAADRATGRIGQSVQRALERGNKNAEGSPLTLKKILQEVTEKRP